jgi:hypothetical protein
MSKRPADPLNELLRQWAERRVAEGAEAERLRGRVAASVEEAAFLDLPPVLAGRRAAGLWGRLAWFAMGAAAAIVAVCVFQTRNQEGRPMAGRQEPVENLSALVQFPSSQLAEKGKLLAGVEELFGGRLAWLAEDGGKGQTVQLGLLPEGEVLRGAKPVVVRVVVLARQGGSLDWKPVWRADLVTHEEQLVEVPQDTPGGARLRMWTQPLPDGLIAVDSELAFDGQLPVRSRFSGIQRGGVPQRVFSAQTGDVEYEVYQTVAPLRPKVS